MSPDPGVEHPEAIKADYQMKDGMLILDMRAPLVGNALRLWAVDCTPWYGIDPKQHHLYIKNPQTLSQYYWSDLAEVQDFATKWMWSYNHDRPNMALGGFTPKQRLWPWLRNVSTSATIAKGEDYLRLCKRNQARRIHLLQFENFQSKVKQMKICFKCEGNTCLKKKHSTGIRSTSLNQVRRVWKTHKL